MPSDSECSQDRFEALAVDNIHEPGVPTLPDRADVGCSHLVGDPHNDCPIHSTRRNNPNPSTTRSDTAAECEIEAQSPNLQVQSVLPLTPVQGTVTAPSPSPVSPRARQSPSRLQYRTARFPVDPNLETNSAPVTTEAGSSLRGGRVGQRGGRGRRRGGSTTKGSQRRAKKGKQGTAQDPSKGWTISNPGEQDIMTDARFMDIFFTERVHLSLLSAVQRLNVEREVRRLTFSRGDMVILFVDEVLRVCTSWLGEHMVLNNIDDFELTLSDMYRYLAVLLLSHCTGFSMSKVAHDIVESCDGKLSTRMVTFIHNNILGYAPTGRAGGESFAWNSMRDRTVQLSEFERKAFRVSARVFLNPNHTHCTLDDDLFGTRASDNQRKTISARKSDREGHSADVVADALFRVVLHLRFRRRSERKEESVKNRLTSLLENRGEQCLKGIFLTLDGGYASQKVVETLCETGVTSMSIVQSYFLKCHPFVGSSYLFPGRAEEDESDEPVNGPEDEDIDGINYHSLQNLQADRRSAFIIDDSPNAGPSFVRAVKHTRPNASNSQRISALAIRERGNKKFSNILRFFHTLPASLDRNILHWTALPYTTELKNHLFRVKDKYGRILVNAEAPDEEQKRQEERILVENKVLTVGQRCADWFILRQFRITSTVAARILMRDANFRRMMNWNPSTVAQMTKPEMQTALCETWFSGTRSTEAMMRGTVNEEAVVSYLRTLPYFPRIWQVGLISDRIDNWFACSPDGVGLFDPRAFDAETTPEFDENPRPLECFFEIKTRVSDLTVQRAIEIAAAKPVYCLFGDAAFKIFVPEEHAAQLCHIACVLRYSYGVYVAASESQVLYIVLAFIPPLKISEIAKIEVKLFEDLVKWAHGDEVRDPQVMDDATRKIFLSKIPFWRVVNKNILANGPFIPIRVFRHSCQTIYSKTRGGVDGSAQARAILRCPTDSLKWEQKIVTQVLKTVCVNGWIAWRMLQKEDLLRDVETFRSLDHYRACLNKVQSLADFIHDLSVDLLAHANRLESNSDSLNSEGSVEVKETPGLRKREIAKLLEAARNKKRYRIEFFNTADGVKLRLHYKHHDHVRVPQELYCVLCGWSKEKDKFRGHRTNTKCKQCDVHLCVKPQKGFRRSCWDVWHTIKQLKKRVVIGYDKAQEGDEQGAQSPSHPVSHKRTSNITTRQQNKRQKLSSP